MDYEDFKNYLKENIQKKYDERGCVRIQKVLKNNHIEWDALTIYEKGSNLSPVIYLQRYYVDYLKGMDIHEIEKHILSDYEQAKIMQNWDVSFFENWDKVRSRIICRVVGRDRNLEVMDDIPHRDYLDLAVIYYYLLEEDMLQDAVIQIKNEHLRLWNISEEELDREARANTGKLMPPYFVRMDELIREIQGNTMPEELQIEELPLFVLTNCVRMYGAYWITDRNLLKQIFSILNTDYYVLPSSVHECLIVSKNNGPDPAELKNMVREVNETAVEPEEILSDKVYYYNSLQEELVITSDAEKCLQPQ